MTRDSHRFRHCRSVALAFAGVLAPGIAWPGFVGAETGDIEFGAFEGIEVLETAELAQTRGAFIDAFGVLVEFGAEIRTIIQGTPVFQTNLNMTGSGEFERSLVFLPDPSVDLVGSGVTSVTTPDGVPVQLVGEIGASLAGTVPSNVDLSGLGGTSGFVIEDATGFTAVLHGVSVGRLVNTIANTGSGRDIVQEMDVRITLHNMDNFRQNAQLERLRLTLDRF